MIVMAIADRYQDANTTISRRTQRQLAAIWRDIDFEDLDGWFRSHKRELVAAVRRGQIDSAILALPYLQGHALEVGISITESAPVAPAAFATGSTTDAQLTRILQGSVILTKYRVSQGYDETEALKSGGQRLFGLSDLLVRDAGREALAAQMTMMPQCVGYERKANGASCGRCLILLGKFFKTNQGFQRHPQDDCVHVPVFEVNGERVGSQSQHPEDIFNEMTPAQQTAALGKDAELVRSGKVSLQDAVNTRMRRPDKLDRLHKVNSPKGLRIKYGSNPQKFAEEMSRSGFLA